MNVDVTDYEEEYVDSPMNQEEADSQYWYCEVSSCLALWDQTESPDALCSLHRVRASMISRLLDKLERG